MKITKWEWFNSYGDRHIITVEHANNQPLKITVDNHGTIDTYSGSTCMAALNAADRETYEEVSSLLYDSLPPVLKKSMKFTNWKVGT